MAHNPSVEGVVMFGGTYSGRRVLVLGHTGFKGSWLTLWLQTLGAKVTGVALPPATTPNHWDLLALDIPSYHQDIRDGAALTALIKTIQPEIIFHLAAQPLVRHSYAEPVTTWSTNVMGTVNVLEACRAVDSVRAAVVVTTDKCYENNDSGTVFRESDKLGGHDPYSASKAAAELVAASYRASFFNQKDSPLLATARAGNVIGGGDWSNDRLIPDLIRAQESDTAFSIRSPNATRPWQHVLESLSGYLLLGERLLAGDASCATAWNFGPAATDCCSVETLLTKLQHYWPELAWDVAPNPSLHEAQTLMLDSSRATTQLGWTPVWNLDMALKHTAEWYQAYRAQTKIMSREQLQHYTDVARSIRSAA
jgi:CDP-glucose 4,6-dehydratase